MKNVKNIIGKILNKNSSKKLTNWYNALKKKEHKLTKEGIECTKHSIFIKHH